MKKGKAFNVDDKVFAKVKGYPAWPAKIVNKNDKKYEVLFYGTKETASLKAEDLFYYLKHKAQFLKKSINRKFYTEAIEEIEAEIEKTGGTDGNSKPDNLDLTIVSNTSLNGSILETNNSIKRKRSKSIDDKDESSAPTQKKVSKKNSAYDEDQINKETVQDESDNKEVPAKKEVKTRAPRGAKTKSKDDDTLNETTPSKKRGPRGKKSVVGNTTLDTFVTTKKVQPPKADTDKNMEVIENEETYKDNADKEGKESKTKDKEGKIVTEDTKEENNSKQIELNIVSETYIQNLIDYAECLKSKEEIYKKKPVEKRQVLKNEVVMVKSPSGSYVGVKFNKDIPPTCKFEFERAQYDEKEAKRVLDLIEQLQSESLKPEENEELFVINHNKSEAGIKEATDLRIIERKKAKLTWLKVESSMVDLDSKIKSALGLFNADPKQALNHLQAMLSLDIEPLMLKKHPHVTDMVKRLRKYIGNTKEWKMTEEEETNFKTNADKIRELAETVYRKFKSLFGVPEEKSFWDFFCSEVALFNENAKDLTEGQIFALCAEPDSQQAFLDHCIEKNEPYLEGETGPSDNEKQNKENSSQAANGTIVSTEDSHADPPTTETTS